MAAPVMAADRLALIQPAANQLDHVVWELGERTQRELLELAALAVGVAEQVRDVGLAVVDPFAGGQIDRALGFVVRQVIPPPAPWRSSHNGFVLCRSKPLVARRTLHRLEWCNFLIFFSTLTTLAGAKRRLCCVEFPRNRPVGAEKVRANPTWDVPGAWWLPAERREPAPGARFLRRVVR